MFMQIFLRHSFPGIRIKRKPKSMKKTMQHNKNNEIKNGKNSNKKKTNREQHPNSIKGGKYKHIINAACFFSQKNYSITIFY